MNEKMYAGPSGVGETVETKMKRRLADKKFSFIMPPEGDEQSGPIRRPWQIMDHLIVWNRLMDFHLLVSDVVPKNFPREPMISGDLAEMKELATRFAHDHGTVVQLFYGDEVPDVPDNRQNAILCYRLFVESRELAGKVQQMFQQTEWYAQVQYEYLSRCGQYEYSLNGDSRRFAMTLEGLSLFRDFLKSWYSQVVADKEKVAQKDPAKKQEFLMMKLTTGMQIDRLVPDNDLAQLATRVLDGWRALMVDTNLPITECNREAGESVYSMVQFERMMAERRGEDWHNWL